MRLWLWLWLLRLLVLWLLLLLWRLAVGRSGVVTGMQLVIVGRRILLTVGRLTSVSVMRELGTTGTAVQPRAEKFDELVEAHDLGLCGVEILGTRIECRRRSDGPNTRERARVNARDDGREWRNACTTARPSFDRKHRFRDGNISL